MSNINNRTRTACRILLTANILFVLVLYDMYAYRILPLFGENIGRIGQHGGLDRYLFAPLVVLFLTAVIVLGTMLLITVVFESTDYILKTFHHKKPLKRKRPKLFVFNDAFDMPLLYDKLDSDFPLALRRNAKKAWDDCENGRHMMTLVILAAGAPRSSSWETFIKALCDCITVAPITKDDQLSYYLDTIMEGNISKPLLPPGSFRIWGDEHMAIATLLHQLCVIDDEPITKIRAVLYTDKILADVTTLYAKKEARRGNASEQDAQAQANKEFAKRIHHYYRHCPLLFPSVN